MKKSILNFKFSILKNNKRSGFTLIELLLYMGIFSIFLVLTLQMFTSIFDIQLESEATTSVSTDAKYIIERFSYDLNRATNISIPNTYGTTSATLSFISEGNNMNYALNNGNLILENVTNGTSDQLNSSETSVSNLSFMKLDGSGKDVVQMSFTLTSVTTQRSGKEVVDYKTSAGMR